MDRLAFEPAAKALAQLYAAAEPRYASDLSREIFDLLHSVHELEFVFAGFPRDKASEMATAKTYQSLGTRL